MIVGVVVVVIGVVVVGCYDNELWLFVVVVGYYGVMSVGWLRDCVVRLIDCIVGRVGGLVIVVCYECTLVVMVFCIVRRCL